MASICDSTLQPNPKAINNQRRPLSLSDLKLRFDLCTFDVEVEPEIIISLSSILFGMSSSYSILFTNIIIYMYIYIFPMNLWDMFWGFKKKTSKESIISREQRITWVFIAENSSPLAAWRPGFSLLVLRLLCAKNCGSDQGCFLTGNRCSELDTAKPNSNLPLHCNSPRRFIEFEWEAPSKTKSKHARPRFVNPNMLVPWSFWNTGFLCDKSFFESVSLRSGEKQKINLGNEKKPHVKLRCPSPRQLWVDVFPFPGHLVFDQLIIGKVDGFTSKKKVVLLKELGGFNILFQS